MSAKKDSVVVFALGVGTGKLKSGDTPASQAVAARVVIYGMMTDDRSCQRKRELLFPHAFRPREKQCVRHAPGGKKATDRVFSWLVTYEVVEHIKSYGGLLRLSIAEQPWKAVLQGCRIEQANSLFYIFSVAVTNSKTRRWISSTEPEASTI